MITAGIDIGSVSAKVVILGDEGILGSATGFTGYRSGETGERLLDELCASIQVNRDSLDAIVSTGYGRKNIASAGRQVTEILCHGAGVHFQFPEAAFCIDIGGQDSKAILLDGKGGVKDFVMNDRCAAGTGRFLEVMARALELELEEFSRLSLESQNETPISSTCTVFAESEVISLISSGAARSDIAAGINASIAERTIAMARRIGMAFPVMMTGGVAFNRGIVAALELQIKAPVRVTPLCQLNGALGAAVLGRKKN